MLFILPIIGGDIFDSPTDVGRVCFASVGGGGPAKALKKFKETSQQAVSAPRAQYYAKFRY